MTSTPQNTPPQNTSQDTSSQNIPSRADEQEARITGATVKAATPRKLQDDPRAQLALAKKNQAAKPTAATGAGHAKAAHESSKQGKKEKKVRW